MSYHDKHGKFCGAKHAHTKSKDGQHYRIVRSHRRIGPNGKEIRVKRGARGLGPKSVAQPIRVARAKVEHVMSFLGLAHPTVEEVFGEWSNEGGVKSTFKHKGGTGKKKARSYKPDRSYGKLVGKTKPGKKSAKPSFGDKTKPGRVKKGTKMVFGVERKVG